jgi:hypothetical protein
MKGDFLILNGDTLISEPVVQRVQRGSQWPIAVTVDVKPEYDNDDMKVMRAGERLVRMPNRSASWPFAEKARPCSVRRCGGRCAAQRGCSTGTSR